MYVALLAVFVETLLLLTPVEQTSEPARGFQRFISAFFIIISQLQFAVNFIDDSFLNTSLAALG